MTIVRFQPDERKEGGAYAENRGRLRRLDPQNRTLELEDGTVIPLEDVVEIRPGTDGSNY